MRNRYNSMRHIYKLLVQLWSLIAISLFGEDSQLGAAVEKLAPFLYFSVSPYEHALSIIKPNHVTHTF